MEKKIFLYLFFIFCGIATAQETFVRVTFDNISVDHLNDGESVVNERSYIITAITTTNEQIELINCVDGVCTRRLFEGGLNTYKLPAPIRSFRVTASAQSGFVQNGGNSTPNFVSDNQSFNVQSNRCLLDRTSETNFDFQTVNVSIVPGVGQPGITRNDFRMIIGFSYEVYPVADAERRIATGLASNDHELTVNVTSETENFPDDTYQWQFQVRNIGQLPNNAWINIVDVPPGPELRIIPSLLSGNLVGRTLFFRVNSCGENRVFGNVVSFDIVNPVPDIIDHTPIQTSCHDSGDGSVRIFFNRQLRSATDELVSFSIVNLDTGESDTVENNIDEFEVQGGNFFYDIGGLSPNRYRLDIIGTEDGLINFSGDEERNTFNFEITPPTPVTFTVTNVIDVRCNDGEDPADNFDGSFRINGTGGSRGTFNYEYFEIESPANRETGTFGSGTRHTALGLAPGTYRVSVRKQITATSVFCNATNSDNNNFTFDVVIEDPERTLNAELVNELEPTGFGLDNGSLTVKVTGGTRFTDDSYIFTWTDSDENILNTVSAAYEEEDDNGFFVTLEDIPGGTYNLTVTDNNFSTATFKTGCILENQVFTLGQPAPLEVEFEETQSILCNISSNDESANVFDNGQITATVTGGVPLDPLANFEHLYFYHWKKLNSETDVFEDLDEQSNILSNLSVGQYALNIEDANGVILGDYSVDVENPIPADAEFTLTEPDLIVIDFDKEDVYCFGGSDGSITLNITGGTGDYQVEWNHNGSNANELTGLLPDTYFVTVTDDNGCKAYQSIEITEPEELVVSFPSSDQPTAFGLSNGWIEAKVVGGTAFGNGSYTFEWTNEAGDVLNSQVTTVVNTIDDSSEFILTLNNIPSDTYFLTITDANINAATNRDGCGIIELSFPLEEPAPLVVVIEEQKPISCNQENEYGNPFSDGALVANVTGGVPFTDGGSQYRYTWKRQNEDTGEWEVLNTQLERISTNLDAGSYALNIEDANGIVLGNYVNNILEQTVDSTFVFNEPELLQINFTKRDVFCNLGSDGIVEAQISGGTPPYTIQWNTGETTIEINNLPAGNYEAIVTDSRGCTVIGDIDIIEPLDPININYSSYGRPSSIGASDAFIVAQITGGTAFDNDSYVFEWKNAEGEIINTQTEVSFITVDASLVYQIRINDIIAGRYFLTIKDKNHQIANTKDGCTISDSEFIIYEPIEAVIEVETPISCNQANEFVDPFSDGALIVTVEGGLPFTEGLPYKYIWKKQNDLGEWIILEGQDTEIATGLSTGNYALNVEDSLGDVIGIYESEILIQAIDSTFIFEEPDLVQLELSSTPISCDTGNDGTATVIISGGISDYEIEWSNGETTSTITNLIAGTYFVFVTDSRGCRATGQVTIGQPGGLDIEIAQQINPTCFEGNDGIISVNVTGGVLPYTFLWSTGDSNTSITNLVAGEYTLQITDGNDCNAFVTIILEDPDEITLDLGEDRTLCSEQIVPFDITIDDEGASYSWESNTGFSSTSPQVEITESGIYTATITSSLGCTVNDEILINISDQIIDADFLVTSQAYAQYEIVLVNVSDPIGEITEWTFPEEAIVLENTDERLILSFDNPGTYEINLRSRVGDCFADYTKSIIVEKASEFPDLGDTQSPFIDDFLVYPNPSSGEFKVKLSLSEQAPINIRIVSILSSEVVSEVKEEAVEFLIDFDLTQYPPGMYMLMLETPVGISIRKIIIN